MATQHPPASSYPPGYLDEYKGGSLVVLAAVLIILETLFVALRFYARRQTTSRWGWDDFLIPVAWLSNIGLCILAFTMVNDAGVGRHLAAVLIEDPRKLVNWFKSIYTLEWLFFTSVALPKISILCLYLRIFTTRGARITCYVMIGVIVANWIAFVLAATFQCSPVAYQWDKKIPGGHCFDISAFYKSSSVPNIATDLVVLILPIPTVLALKASMIRKLGLMFVFLTGSVGLIASCVRTTIFFQNDAFTDTTWVSVVLTTWSIVECAMYLIAACLLALRPLFTKWTPRWLVDRLYGSRSRRSTPLKGDSRRSFRLGGLQPVYSSSGFTEIGSKRAGEKSANARPAMPASSSSESRLYESNVEAGFAPPTELEGIRVERDIRITPSRPEEA